ncbi:MAG TPA: nucleotide sugar dehydrogenase [Armatimonadota bacterium]|nr:nucleotide sugar dehydrogenase [Armatimonadota bacterium]
MGLKSDQTAVIGAPTATDRLAQALLNREARVAVIGLGYVGLPLCVELAEAGFRTLGYDLNPQRAAQVRKGDSPIGDVPSARLARAIADKRLRAGADAALLRDADVFVICVPTPFTKARQPDLSHVIRAGQDIAPHLAPGRMVILESTTYPGTTRDVLRPLLEASGRRAGDDFALAFAPERVDPNNQRFNIANTPRIVGGYTPRCAGLAALLYRQLSAPVVTVSSLQVAEMAKLLENTFRHVNIALANEMAIICADLGIDVWEVIAAAATKPFGFMPFYPGPGVGGHCIPIDPCYLSYRVRELGRHARFIELAETINEQMPDYVVLRVADALNQHGRALRGARILVLGAAYKRDVADPRESPAIHIISRLQDKGAQVRYHDPLIPELNQVARPLRSVDLTAEEMEAADCAIIVTDHTCLPYAELARRCRLIFDTRNALRDHAGPNIVRL